MRSKIILQQGTKKIPVYEIPSLVATALCLYGSHPEHKLNTFVTEVKKRIKSTGEVLPLTSSNDSAIRDIFNYDRDRNIEICYRTKEQWNEFEAKFNKSDIKPNFDLHPIWETMPNPKVERLVLDRVYSDAKITSSKYKLNVKYPRKKITTIIDGVEYNYKQDPYVTIQEFIRYVGVTFSCEVQLIESSLIKIR